MTVTRRWLDSGQAAPEVLELLKAARPPAALDSATRARSRRRLAAATALPVAVGVSFWLKSVALGAVLGSAVTVAIVVPDWGEAPQNQSGVPGASTITHGIRRTSNAPASSPAVSAVAVSPLEDDAGSPSAMRAPSATSGGASALKTTPAAPAAFNDDLGREIQLLERARQLLTVDPGRALATLNEHEREFGRGTLGLERQFLEIEALLRLGERDVATQRAATLRARAPGSLYERRLKQLLGDDHQ